MATPTKPILYNGFKIKEGLTIKNRIEKVFFTEIYGLSDDSYFYLLLNIKPNEVVDRGKKYELIKIQHAGSEYIGIITKEHSHDKVTQIIEDLTVMRGFDCVAGMKELKALLINDVISPLLHPEKFKKFKLSIPNGILLYGPPGCGKTFIVRKLAEEISYNFIELKPSDVATPYVHGAVSNIAKVFEMAKLKAPSIIFIDEIEGLLPKREELSSSADIKKEEINQFLMELNDAGNNKILVVGATNRPHMIDTAILRSGRMDKRIYVPPPDFEARKELFEIHLSGRPYDKSIDFEKLAKLTENFVSSDVELIVTEAARAAVAGNLSIIDEKLIASIIERFTPSVTEEQVEYYEQFKNLERS
mgnify:CR=1 FL=1